MATDTEASLRFNVVCGFCSQLLDSYTLDELATGTWKEAALWGALWGALAHDTHRERCPERRRKDEKHD